MLEEIRRLARDLDELAPAAFAQARELCTEPRQGAIALIGCGDSLVAAQAMASAFSCLNDRGAHPFFPRVVGFGLGVAQVIGISASGDTKQITAALLRARAAGIHTLLVTGNAASEAGQAADAQMVLPLANKMARVPGIRSYQASLLGLLALAMQGRGDWSDRLKALSAEIARAAERCLQQAPGAAAILDGSGSVVYLGEGSDLASAAYGVAKRMEASGAFGIARDTEEFWHLERFARDLKTVVLIASSGDTPDAMRMATVAKGLGARLIAIAPGEAVGIRAEADVALDLGHAPDPLLTPFLATVPLAALAAAEAERRGLSPFQQDMPSRMEAMRSRLTARGRSG